MVSDPLMTHTTEFCPSTNPDLTHRKAEFCRVGTAKGLTEPGKPIERTPVRVTLAGCAANEKDDSA